MPSMLMPNASDCSLPFYLHTCISYLLVSNASDCSPPFYLHICISQSQLFLEISVKKVWFGCWTGEEANGKGENG